MDQDNPKQTKTGPRWMLWVLFGMVVLLTLQNIYMGRVIEEQMQEIRALSGASFVP